MPSLFSYQGNYCANVDCLAISNGANLFAGFEGDAHVFGINIQQISQIALKITAVRGKFRLLSMHHNGKVVYGIALGVHSRQNLV